MVDAIGLFGNLYPSFLAVDRRKQQQNLEGCLRLASGLSRLSQLVLWLNVADI